MQAATRVAPKPRTLRSKKEAIKILALISGSITETTSLGHISSDQDSTPFKVLISTILSARTRDPVTEEAAARLFKCFPDAASLSKARRRVVAEVKSGRIIEVARLIENEYSGIVPNSMEELLSLPGVGRKTANCVLVYAFRTPAIPVDVHVHRISNRIGLVRTKTPEQTEVALTDVYSKKHWLQVNELFVRFGQMICKPMVPRCGTCKVQKMCNYYRFEVKTNRRSSSA
jgi:endonuclease-3